VEWVGGLIGGIFSQALSAYFWSKTASLALLSIIGLGAVVVLLGLIWLTSKQPQAGLILSGAVITCALVVVIIGTKQTTPCPICPKPFSTHTEVSASWQARGGTWSSYWTDHAIPKAWKPYEALIRVRIGKNDLYLVLKGGKVLVIGPYDIRAVEPLAGR